ncbi:J domain-containing protein [Streptomyces sp. NPDC000070]|uniref:J domain-containing protein n=1 Tax=Streptomyces sp. NPDC000070 TaxID=3154240 RepID=UPI003319B484
MSGQRPRRDHYAVLGVPRDASAERITSAYRRLVRLLHPDARPEDPAAADRLADVLAAYDTLGDSGRRAAYDAERVSPAPRPGAGRPVPVRVTRKARTSARPGSPSRTRAEASGLRDTPEGLLFSASWHVGPGFGRLPLGLGDGGFVTRVVQRWLRETDSWLR